MSNVNSDRMANLCGVLATALLSPSSSQSSLTGRLAVSRRRLTELRRRRSRRRVMLILLTAVAVAASFAPTPHTVWTVPR